MARLFESPSEVRNRIRSESLGRTRGLGTAVYGLGRLFGVDPAEGSADLTRAQTRQGILADMKQKYAQIPETPESVMKYGQEMTMRLMQAGDMQGAAAASQILGQFQPKSPLVTVQTGDPNKNPFIKQYATKLMDDKTKAESAVKLMQNTREMKALMDEGMVTGFGAKFITSLGRAANQLGFDAGTEVDNAQAYYAAAAQNTAQIIKEFGAGTGLSDADREYAERAAAGDITMTEKSLRKIIDINMRAARNAIKRYNRNVDRVPKDYLQGLDMKIEIPDVEVPEMKPQV